MTADSDISIQQVATALILSCERRIDHGWSAPSQVTASLHTLATDITQGGFNDVDQRFTAVTRALGLNDLQSRLLASTLLAEVHPAAATLIGALSGYDDARLPTRAIALELSGLASSSAPGWSALSPSGLLRHRGILNVFGDGLALSQTIQAHGSIVRRIHGDSSAPTNISALLTPLHPIFGEEEILDGAAAISNGMPLLWIHAPVGTAGAAWAAGICLELSAYPLAVDLLKAGTPGDLGVLRATITDLLLEASLDNSPLVLLNSQLADGAIDLLNGAAVPVIAVATVSWNPAWPGELPLSFTARRLTTTQRSDYWKHALGVTELDRSIAVLRMTPDQISTVGRAVARWTKYKDVAPSAALVTQTARSLNSASSANQNTPASLSDLVLPDHTINEISRLINWGRHRDDLLHSTDLQGKGGKGTGIAALFSGNPGTGKTLAAHVLCDALGMELMQVDLSSIVDKYIGETEKNLERVFSAAESMNCVLFFDEADSLFGSRSAVTDSRDRYANQEVAYLLQRIEAFNGITVLATNLRGNIDTAFARRLHFMIHFPDPDEATRLRLWNHHIAQVSLIDADDPPQVELLAGALEVAGGDIRNIVLAAAFDAISTDAPLAMHHLVTAANREFAKLGRRAPGEALAPNR